MNDGEGEVMEDKKLIDLVARLWTQNGGDADGLDFCHAELKQRIAELLEERRQNNETYRRHV